MQAFYSLGPRQQVAGRHGRIRQNASLLGAMIEYALFAPVLSRKRGNEKLGGTYFLAGYGVESYPIPVVAKKLVTSRAVANEQQRHLPRQEDHFTPLVVLDSKHMRVTLYHRTSPPDIHFHASIPREPTLKQV